jgi:hypothetical protein
LHVFPAVSVASAVAFGQAILPKIGPKFIIYDKQGSDWGRALAW